MKVGHPEMSKEQSRKVRAEIRRVLLELWDPIGIVDEPNAQNEYDSYLGDIYASLHREDSVDQVQDHLYVIVRDRMGMSPPATREHMLPAAEALKRISFSP
jgi:hypothetical protein